VAQIMASARRHNAKLAGSVFSYAVASGTASQPEQLAKLLNETRLVAEWCVSDDAGRPVASWRPGAGLAPGGPPIATARDATGHTYHLYGQPTPGGMGLGDYFSETVPSMLVGIALMAAVLLLMLSREVITPVADLAEASRQLASGGDPVRPGGENRRDEVGQLVRSFNRMAGEVVGHRRDMEQRVAEATEKYRRAREAAAIAQRLAATGRLAAGVAHEINNPLGGMVNAARRLEKDLPAGQRGREYLDLISEGLQRIGGIVRQMTQFQRPARELAPVDVAGALGDALRFAGHRLEGVEVHREIAEDLPAVLGDRNALEQVFLNLVLNAADAVSRAAGGEAERKLTVRARAEAGGRLVVEIEDTGCGMTAEERDAAFDIFHTTKGAGEGSGLGLPVAHSIIESHGGELSLESAKGRGTRAIVSLPAAGKEPAT
jgi:signal transduction histidine kinase